MGFLTVKESCCGCTLETGAKIIGYVHLIISCVALLMVGLVVATIMSDDPDTATEKPPLVTTIAHKDDIIISPEFSVAFSISLGLAPAALGVLSLFLLVGAKKKNSYLILPWLVGVGLLVLVYLLVLSLFIFILLSRGRLNNHFVSIVVKMCVCSYCFIVVYSFYRELRSTKPEEPA